MLFQVAIMNKLLYLCPACGIFALHVSLLSLVQAEPMLPELRMQAVPQPYDQISFQRDGVEITRYHFSPSLKRPFLFPLIGPSGQSLTRM